VGTRNEIDSVLVKNMNSVIEASKNKINLSGYTDISGALAEASKMSPNNSDNRVLIILSDFHEELLPGSKKADYSFSGERVILLHRPGTDEPQDIEGYMNRINTWKRKLLERKASAVVAIPVFAVTESRLKSAMFPESNISSTDLTIMIDFKEHVTTVLENNSHDGGLLTYLGKSLASIAGDWHPPVIAQWIALGYSGFTSRALPPIEFYPRLIKKPPALSTVEEFKLAMEELARGIPSMSHSVNTKTDISGSIKLMCSVESQSISHILIVISDFVENMSISPTKFLLSPNTRVIMMHIASPEDRLNPNNYPKRLQVWSQRFIDAGAMDIHQIPLQSFTANDLRVFLGNSN